MTRQEASEIRRMDEDDQIDAAMALVAQGVAERWDVPAELAAAYRNTTIDDQYSIGVGDLLPAQVLYVGPDILIGEPDAVKKVREIVADIAYEMEQAED